MNQLLNTMNLQAQRNLPAKNPVQPQTHGPVDKELEMGIAVEKEHGDDDIQLATKIANDHLKQDSTYYSKLMAAGLVDEEEPQEIAIQRGNGIKHTETRPLQPAPLKVKSSVGNFINADRKTDPLGADAMEHFGSKIGSMCSMELPDVIAIAIGEGGARITEPRAGITSDQKGNRWSIDAYPNSTKKITPKL